MKCLFTVALAALAACPAGAGPRPTVPVPQRKPAGAAVITPATFVELSYDIDTRPGKTRIRIREDRMTVEAKHLGGSLPSSSVPLSRAELGKVLDALNRRRFLALFPDRNSSRECKIWFDPGGASKAPTVSIRLELKPAKGGTRFFGVGDSGRGAPDSLHALEQDLWNLMNAKFPKVAAITVSPERAYSSPRATILAPTHRAAMASGITLANFVELSFDSLSQRHGYRLRVRKDQMTLDETDSFRKLPPRSVQFSPTELGSVLDTLNRHRFLSLFPDPGDSRECDILYWGGLLDSAAINIGVEIRPPEGGVRILAQTSFDGGGPASVRALGQYLWNLMRAKLPEPEKGADQPSFYAPSASCRSDPSLHHRRAINRGIL